MRHSAHILNRGVRWVCAAGILAAGMTLAGCSWSRPAKPETAYLAPGVASARIGQVDRVELLVAYHKSKVLNDRLDAMVRERDDAKARGDRDRVRALNREGSAMQDRAHRQLSGREPLTNVIDAIKDRLPEVAREQNVDRIEIVQKVAATEQSPDVTKAVTGLLPPAK